MKRLLLIGLTTILGLSSLSTIASADSYDHAAGNKDSYRSRDRELREPDLQEEASNFSPIPTPLKYRVEYRPEVVEPEVHKDDKLRRVDRYVPGDDHYRERRRRVRLRRYHHGTRNDPGRY